MPTNESKQDPIIHFIGMLSDGPDKYLEDRNKQGQKLLSGEALLPSSFLRLTKEEMAELGFVVGKVVADDPLFMKVILPDGWTKVATDHPMWTDLRDNKGFTRASIFYKSDFYDRSASMTFERRLSVRTAYTDENGKEFGCFRVEVEARMPGGKFKVLQAFEEPYPLTITPETSMKDREHYFKVSDAVRAKAEAWVLEHFPQWGAANVYWDLDL